MLLSDVSVGRIVLFTEGRDSYPSTLHVKGIDKHWFLGSDLYKHWTVGSLQRCNTALQATVPVQCTPTHWVGS